MTLGARLRSIRKFWGCSAEDMALKMGVSRRTWESYERDESDPKATLLANIIQTGINSDWLMSGEGEMIRQVGNSLSSGAADTWLMSRVVDGVARTYKEVGANLQPSTLGEIAAKIHNEIVGLEGGEDVWRGALALALGRLKTELTDPAKLGTGKSSVSS